MAKLGITLSSEDWIKKEAVYGKDLEDAGEGPRIQCRVSPQILRLMQELRENPSSPFYGRYATLSDMLRDMAYQSTIIMGEGWKTTKDEVVSIRLREHIVERASREKTSKSRIASVVDPAVRAVAADWEEGGESSAVSFLDNFLTTMMDIGDDRVTGEYVNAFLNHGAFSKLRKNVKLREKSNLLVPMEEQYGP